MWILPCLGSPARHRSTLRLSKFGSFPSGSPGERLARVGSVWGIKINPLLDDLLAPRGPWELCSLGPELCEITLKP